MKRKQQNPISSLVNAMGSLVHTTSINPGLAQRYALESLDQSSQAELDQTTEQLEAELKQTLDQQEGVEQGSITDTQLEAAVESIMLTADPVAAKTRMSRGAGQPTLGANDIFIAPNVSDAVERRISLEAYDNQNNSVTQRYSTAYNLLASKQEAAVELFFPTTVVGQDQFGLQMTVRRISVMDEYRRDMNQVLSNNMGRKNVIRALIDPTILRADLTRVIPVFRDETKDRFVDETLLPPAAIVHEGVSITTSALKIGKKFSLLNISQHDALLETGVMDASDALDASVRLKAVYIQLSNTEVIKLTSVGQAEGAQFVPANQGSERRMVMNLSFTGAIVNANTKLVDGSASTVLADIVAAGVSVHLALELSGNIDLQLSDTVVNAGDVVVHAIMNTEGEAIPLDAGPGAAYVADLAAAKIVGYDLEARRINSNKRERGQLVDVTEWNVIYGVPTLSPITSIHPANADTTGDTSDLAALISTTRARASNDGIRKMHETRNLLAEIYTANSGMDVDNNQLLGVGRHYVNPYFESFNLDMTTVVDSTKSSERLADISAALMAVIRDMVYRAVQDSGYQAALDALSGGLNTRPTVIVMTDQRIAPFLMTSGDMRSLGEHYDIQIEVTLNETMKDKIYISFGQPSKAGSADPLHFGVTAWKPEATYVVAMPRNGGYSRELTVNPSYLHVVNLPVLMEINVSKLSDVMDKKVYIKTTP